MKRSWLIGGLAGVLALAGAAFVQVGGNETHPVAPEAEEGRAVQPIAFPHNTHAGSEDGQAKIPCMFCHFSAERSVDAGIPPVATCWGCHQVIPGSKNPQEVAKIGEYFERGEPIPWVRNYKISDHAHFPHMRHINAGLECQQCHGEIQTLNGAITVRRGPRQGGNVFGWVAKVLRGTDVGVNDNPPVWHGDMMGWCVGCHRQPDETGKQQARTDCAVCHY
jgi:Cytochrome c7 and related cytochrome c